jgi:hypothetical protein
VPTNADPLKLVTHVPDGGFLGLAAHKNPMWAAGNSWADLEVHLIFWGSWALVNLELGRRSN